MDKPVSRSRAWIVLLLLSGLVIHDFIKIESFKIGIVTITYLRIILVVTIPCLVFPKFKLFFKDKFAVVFFLFMLYGLMRIEGNLKQAFALYCTLIAFFFLYVSIENTSLVRRCINALATFFIAFCILGDVEIATGYHFRETFLSAGVDNVSRFAAGNYYNPNDFSAFLTVLFFYMMLSSYQWGVKVFFIINALVIITINKSQICLLGILSFMLIAFIMKNRVNRTLRFVVTGMFGLAMIGPVYSMVQDSSLNTRAYMYKYGIQNCISHFWLGTGIGNYAKGMEEVGFTPYFGASADPHNLLLELIGQFGVVWGVLFVVLVIVLIVYFFKRIDIPGYLYCFGLVYIIPFVGLASSSCMEKNYIYLALLIPLFNWRRCKNREKLINSLDFL